MKLARLAPFLWSGLALVGCFAVASASAYAESKTSGTFVPGTSGVSLPSLSLSFGGTQQKPQDVVSVIRIVMMLTVLSLAPAILIMMTSFTRIVVVLSFIRQALGTQQMPPNQLIVGLALFLSFFVMAPTFKSISSNSLEPFLNEKIDQKMAYERAEAPLREFMFNQTREKDLEIGRAHV